MWTAVLDVWKVLVEHIKGVPNNIYTEIFLCQFDCFVITRNVTCPLKSGNKPVYSGVILRTGQLPPSWGSIKDVAVDSSFGGDWEESLLLTDRLCAVWVFHLVFLRD